MEGMKEIVSKVKRHDHHGNGGDIKEVRQLFVKERNAAARNFGEPQEADKMRLPRRNRP